LVILAVENKGCLFPDSWYSTWNYSHPPVIERLEAMKPFIMENSKSKDTKSSKKSGGFFERLIKRGQKTE
jgi:hypothetical protein